MGSEIRDEGRSALPDRDLTSADFPVLVPAATRWADNDMYGHLNNAVYYQLFDTAINGWLIGNTGIDPVTTPIQGVVVESGCRYFRSVGFPQPLRIGLAVTRVGRSSVTYALGVLADDEPTVAALGRWVHVYIDPQTRRPVDIPDALRALMQSASFPTPQGDTA